MGKEDKLSGSLEFIMSLLTHTASPKYGSVGQGCKPSHTFESLLGNVSYRVCQPWQALRDHLHAHTMLVATIGAGALAHLVYHPDELHNQIRALCEESAWDEMVDDIPATMVADMLACILEIYLASLAEFKVRILSRTSSLPVSLLLFAKLPQPMLRGAQDPGPHYPR